MKRFFLPAIAAVLTASCTAPTPVDRLRGDEATAREAIAGFCLRGEAAIPELKAALVDPDPLVRRHAKTALGRITGQWGCDTGLVWTRKLDEAIDRGRPILVLQLFGKLDEEFC